MTASVRRVGNVHSFLKARIPGSCGSGLRWAVASASLLLAALLLDSLLTRTMSLHMLVHIPLILLAGICAARSLSRRPAGAWARRLAAFDMQGLAGLLLFNIAGAYWMIPKALDDVLLHWPDALSKYLSMFIVGVALYHALRRSHMVVQLFFLGNFCWMLAIVGMLYRDSVTRLCNFYLLDDQEIAGNGLLALAIILPLVWLWVWRHRIGDFLR
jgi:hypothetical protein